MELTDEVYNAINRYFSVLSHTGYKSYDEVYKLLVFSFIEELLYGPFAEFITEKDYNLIMKSVDCLYGSCMIPYPEYKRSYDETVKSMPDKYRITEAGIIRSSGSADIRVES